MNRLSLRAAQRCENAQEKSCKCRCGGAMHGAKRGAVTELPYGDPHSLLEKCKDCNGAGVYSIHNFKCYRCDGSGYILPRRVVKKMS